MPVSHRGKGVLPLPLTTPGSPKHIEKWKEAMTTGPQDKIRQNVQQGCLKGLIWVDLIIAKGMNSKYGKAIKVIKDITKMGLDP